jgi:hypothetical protein
MKALLLRLTLCIAPIICCRHGFGQEHFDRSNQYERAASDAVFLDFSSIVVDGRASDSLSLTEDQVEKINDIQGFYSDAVRGILREQQPKPGETHAEISKRFSDSGAEDLIKKFANALEEELRGTLSPEQIEVAYVQLLSKRFETSGIIGVVVSQRDIPFVQSWGLPPLREFLQSMDKADDEFSDELKQLTEEFKVIAEKYRQRVKAIQNRISDKAMLSHGLDPVIVRDNLKAVLPDGHDVMTFEQESR